MSHGDPGETSRCIACGGAGGGPFGRAGSAWDTEDYVCPRCRGTGVERLEIPSARPGIAKAAKAASVAPARKRVVGDS